MLRLKELFEEYNESDSGRYPICALCVVRVRASEETFQKDGRLAD